MRRGLGPVALAKARERRQLACFFPEDAAVEGKPSVDQTSGVYREQLFRNGKRFGRAAGVEKRAAAQEPKRIILRHPGQASLDDPERVAAAPHFGPRQELKDQAGVGTLLIRSI